MEENLEKEVRKSIFQRSFSLRNSLAVVVGSLLAAYFCTKLLMNQSSADESSLIWVAGFIFSMTLATLLFAITLFFLLINFYQKRTMQFCIRESELKIKSLKEEEIFLILKTKEETYRAQMAIEAVKDDYRNEMKKIKEEIKSESASDYEELVLQEKIIFDLGSKSIQSLEQEKIKRIKEIKYVFQERIDTEVSKIEMYRTLLI